MPSQLKKLIRERRQKTGESYQAALAQVRKGVREATPRATSSGVPPRSGFESVARDVIRLAKAAVAEYRASQTENPNDDIKRQLFEPRKPQEAALDEYLAALPYEMMRKLEVVMFAGRDGEDPLEIHATEALHAHGVIWSTLIGKSLRLADYLESGMRLARELRIDLEAPLPKRDQEPAPEDDALVDEALGLRKLFAEKLSIVDAARLALSQSPDPLVLRANHNAFAELESVERLAVEAHCRANKPLSPVEMLLQAWVEAGAVGTRPPTDQGSWDAWATAMLSQSNLAESAKAEGKNLLGHAIQFSRDGRFLSAAQMLRKFRTLNRTWVCDVCGEPINEAHDGWIEWTADKNRKPAQFRLVHHFTASPRPAGCYREELLPRLDRPLEDFLERDLIVDLKRRGASHQELAELANKIAGGRQQ